MLYPQNGDRMVTIDSVTSRHPVYVRLLCHTKNMYFSRAVGPTSRPHVASPTWSATEHVARPATKRYHPSHGRALEACCRPWTWWCNDATALAGYATMTMIMSVGVDWYETLHSLITGLLWSLAPVYIIRHNYPRESEGLCFYRRWFVCLSVCLSVCLLPR